MKGLLAHAQARINCPVSEVWDALVNPAIISRYMFGTIVASEWKKGSAIIWKGIWQGRAYEDRGVILELVPERLLTYTHFSPLSGLPDIPTNYHNVKIELSAVSGATVISLSQDNNPTKEARDHSQRNWKAMLTGLKELLEGKPQA